MENNYKQIGKIENYDGEAGLIITDDKIYNFSKKDLLEDIKNNEYVEFIPNTLPFGDEKLYIAREISQPRVKKLTKDNY